MRTTIGLSAGVRQGLLAVGLGLGILLAPAEGQAGRVTDLATSFEGAGNINVDLRVGYDRTLKRGAIKREFAGMSDTSMGLVKDLRFSQVKHTLSLRSDFSLWRVLQLYLELPIVLDDTRTLDLAQNGGDPCGSPTETDCVTPKNSTTFIGPGNANGLRGLWDGSQMPVNQVSVAGPDRPTGGMLLPHRSGLDQLYIGLAGAPLDQKLDPTKPTWVLGFEARIGIGSDMRYDPANPTANTSVGSGLSQYLFWTSVSRRYRYVDPWFSLFYLLPVAKDDSLYQQTTFSLSGQERSGPQQRGGGEIGVEFIPYEKPEANRRVSIALSARLEGVFEGRGYSEMWEVFANNPVLAGPCRPYPAGGSSVRPGYWNNNTHCSSIQGQIPYPGITSIENYAIVTGSLAVGVELTRFFRAHIGFSLGHEQEHRITFADTGRADPMTGVINPLDELQVNPMYRPYVDAPGRRYVVSETTVFDFFVSTTGQF